MDVNGNVAEWLYQGEDVFKHEEKMPDLALPSR